MPRVLDPFRFVLVAVAGWMNQRQLQIIDYGQDRRRKDHRRVSEESGGFLARRPGEKFEAGLVTLCHSEGRPLFGPNCCVETQLCHG